MGRAVGATFSALAARRVSASGGARNVQARKYVNTIDRHLFVSKVRTDPFSFSRFSVSVLARLLHVLVVSFHPNPFHYMNLSPKFGPLVK